MDKNAIKKFATEARRELLHRVSQKALMYGISEKLVDSGQWSVDSAKSVQLPDTDALGRLLTDTELAQRDALLEKILEEGYSQVMEEVAYTWFNRFSALRFMEVNGYLPSKVRIFTDPDNRFQPQILTEAIHLDMEGLDVEKVFAYKEANDTEGLFRYLLITQCNALSTVLPGMFQPLSDYTELLLPEGLLKEDSVIRLMIDTVPEEDWRDAVQIIGWLYQYYNSEKKDEVFAALKKNVKITKDNIPAATQLFTPDWIVRYMVENSLGRTYIRYKMSVTSGQWTVVSEEERQAKEKEIAESLGWKYYLPEAKQTEEVRKQLNQLNPDTFDPKDLRLLDPCAGSGHILAYMFDVMVTIYQDYGYTTREAAASIVSQNLYGLDIDTRAAQLAYFTVMMKARQYDRRFFSRGIQPHVHAITESNHVGEFTRNHFAPENPSVKEAFHTVLEELRDAKEYGSILTVTSQDWEALEANLEELEHSTVHSDGKRIRNLLQTAEALSQKYDIVVTNPPYMGASNMNPKLNDFIKKNYADYKSDLSTVCMERATNFCKENGFWSMINIPVWMFLSSYEKLRGQLLSNQTIVNMVHPGRGIFGSDFGTTTFVFENHPINGYAGSYRRLFDKQGEVEGIEAREKAFLSGKGNFVADQSNFTKIPGSPVAYWVGEAIFKDFERGILKKHATTKQGFKTGDNNYFLRYWFEPELNKSGLYGEKNKKWIPCTKGGDFRRWYGNLEYVVNWENDGAEIKGFVDERGKLRSRPQNLQINFKPAISWSSISSSKIHFRIYDDKMMYESKGPVLLSDDSSEHLLGYLNTKVYQTFIDIVAPTLDYSEGSVLKVPYNPVLENENNVSNLVSTNISLSRADWDSYETSWDFRCNPLVNYRRAGSGQQSVNSSPNALTTLSDCYEAWKATCNARFKQLQANEEELNRIFIDIYGLQEELTPEVANKDVTVHCIFDTKEDIPESLQGSNYVRTKRDEIVSFISYAVGCMLGRYSLEKEGLFYAGGEFSNQWVAVSGQYYEREVVEYYVSKELSRSCGMAEVYVHSGGDISVDEDSSELGKILVIGSDEKSRNLDSFQYRRGTSQKLYEGIQTISLHCEGIRGGAGDTVYDLCSPEILKAISDRDGNELAQRGWKDAERIDWDAIQQNLTTDHYPLNSDHFPLATAHFSPDEDNVLPICDDEYFQDDIVGRLIEFVRVVYGEETLEENLEFISQALGGKKGERPKDVIRNYFLKDFYKDHCKMYQKRPIYWLFDSGKKNGFKCLVYLHRYRRDTIARIRTDYIHPQQSRYRTLLEDLESRLEDASTTEKVRLRKEIKLRSDQLTEIHAYEEKIHHLADSMISIDLDDGVKKNYAIFQDVLAKIK